MVESVVAWSLTLQLFRYPCHASHFSKNRERDSKTYTNRVEEAGVRVGQAGEKAPTPGGVVQDAGY
jgi:hypothetical protein